MGEAEPAALIGPPDILNPKLSPDGGRIAFSSPSSQVQNVHVVSEVGDPMQVTFEPRPVRWSYSWFGSGAIVYTANGGGRTWHLAVAHLDGAPLSVLADYPGVRVDILGVSKHRRSVIALMNWANPDAHDVYEVDLDGAAHLLVENAAAFGAAAPADSWIYSHDALGAAQTIANGELVLHVNRGQWQVVRTYPVQEALGSRIVAIVGADVYTLEYARGATVGLVRHSASGREVIAVGDGTDLTHVSCSPLTGRPDVANTDVRLDGLVVLDRDLDKDVQAARDALGTDFDLLDRSQDDAVWLLGHRRLEAPTTYHLFDRPTKKIRLSLSERPRPRLGFSAETVEVRSRDGLSIPGFLYLPTTSPARGAVVLIHPGPWDRHRAQYDSNAAWFASLGLACVAMNYRGSTGYGLEHLELGTDAVATGMADDVAASAAWVRRRLGLPVATYGWSFGGYLALMAAAREQAISGCVSIIGTLNLETWALAASPYRHSERSQRHFRLGAPTAGRYPRSPFDSLDTLKCPTLLVSVEDDWSAPAAEAMVLHKALTHRGVSSELITLPSGGHDISDSSTRRTVYEETGRFLLGTFLETS